MADRTVKVVLKADVSAYVRDVGVAHAVTRELRQEAERFAKKYTAVLDVKTRGAAGIRQAEQSMTKMSKATGDLQGRLAGLRKELADLENGGGKAARAEGIASLNKQIARVKSNLASLNNQKITIAVASEITQGNIELANLEQRLERLDKSTYTPELDLRRDNLRKAIAGAERDVRQMAARLADQKLQLNPGEFATRLRRQVAAAAKSLPDIPLHADSSSVDREIASIRAELVALSQVRAQHAEAAAKRATDLQQRLQRISNTSTSSNVKVNTGSAAAELGKLEVAGKRADRVLNQISTSSDRSSRGLFHTARTAADTARALRTLAIPPALLASAPAIGSLAASVGTMAKALAVIPALGFAAGAGFGAIAIGLKGWGEVAKQLGKGDLEKATTAAQELAPAARETALELVKMADAYDKAASVVQQNLFKDGAKELRELGKDYLPLISTGLGGIAAELNTAAVAFSDFATRVETVKDAKEGLELIQLAAIPLAGTVENLSMVMRDMGRAGAEELPRMSVGFEIMTGKLRRYIAEARQNGDINRWITDGIEEISQFGRVLGNTGSIMASVFAAADASGVSFLDTLERITGSAAKFLNSAPGEDALLGFFGELRDAGDALLPGLQALGSAAAAIIGHLENSHTLTEAARAFSAIATEAAPVLETLGELTSQVLPPLLRFIQDIAPALGPAVGAFIGLRIASNGLSKVAAPAAAGLGTALLGGAAGGKALAGAASTLIGRIPLMGAVIAAVIGTINALEVGAEDVAVVIAKGGAAADRARESYSSTNDTLRAFIQGIPILGSYLSGLVDDQDDLTAAVTKYETQQRNVNNAVLLADQQLKLYNDTVRQFGSDSPQAAYAAEQYKLAVGDLERAQRDAGVATEGHTLALTRQRDQFLGAVGAGIAWKEAVGRATVSVQENGRNVDLNTEAGRRNQRALLDMARAALEDINAQKEHGASTQVITDLTKQHEGQLYRTAIQMGMSEDQAREYVNQLRLTPADQTTRFHTPGLPQAIAGVKELAGLINGLQDQARSNLTGAVGGALDATRRVTGRAMGGPLRGPGSGTSDSIPLMGSNGEWVIRERVTRSEGDQKMALLNSGMGTVVPKSMIPHRASGGPVNRNVTLDFTGAAAAIQKRKNEWYPPMPEGGGMMIGGNGDAGQLGNARIIAQVARAMGFGRNGLVVALATALQESGLRNLNYGDRDSVGLFQQRTSQGWGSIAQIMNPGYSASKFFQGLRGVRGWESMPVTVAAQRVQRSAFPNAYAKWVGLANSLASQVGFDQGGIASGTGVMAKNTIQPERVLSPRQTEAFDRLVSVLDRPTPISPFLAAGVRGGDGAGARVEIHNENHFTEAVDLDLFNQRQDFAVRAVTL